MNVVNNNNKSTETVVIEPEVVPKGRKSEKRGSP